MKIKRQQPHPPLPKSTCDLLWLSEARYRAIVEDQTELICRFLPDGTLSFVNTAYCRYFGKKREKLIGRNFLTLIPAEEQDTVKKQFASLSQENPVAMYEHRVLLANGEIRWQQWTDRAIFDQKGNLIEFQSVGRDITKCKQAEVALQRAHNILERQIQERTAELVKANTALQAEIIERKQMEECLRQMSLYDPITELYNRNYFEQEMRRLEHKRFWPVGLIICDLDGLKIVNDTQGHDVGDALLLNAAKIIKVCSRPHAIVARIGGDEFAILLPNTPRMAVEYACRHIKKAIADYNATNQNPYLSMSMGWAVSVQPSINMRELFKEADNNMYREKLYGNQSTRSALFQTLLKPLEVKDFITRGHAYRLQKLITEVAVALGLPQQKISDLRHLALFHDIGKISVPDHILFKLGPLNTQETIEIRKHCETGYRIALSVPDLIPIADWILKHHEWWNGKGYPLGLKEEEIPLECRILAIIDAYDAMTHSRPYRNAMSQEKAIAELISCSGTQFDPALVTKFIQTLESTPLDQL